MKVHYINISKQDVLILQHSVDYDLNRSRCNKASLAFEQIMFRSLALLNLLKDRGFTEAN